MQEFYSSPIYQSCNYRVTNGGDLACKYIIHVLSPDQAGPIAAVLKEVFSFANDTLKATSLAVPAISTGMQSKNFGYKWAWVVRCNTLKGKF